MHFSHRVHREHKAKSRILKKFLVLHFTIQNLHYLCGLGVLCGKAVISLVVLLLRFEDKTFKKPMVRGPAGRILLLLFDPT